MPIFDQFRQGTSPERIALTIALGVLLSIFPILGATTVLCTLAALFLRLNQPIIQVINYVSYPLQLVLLIPFYRAGETLFRQPHVPLSIPLFFTRIRADFWQFLRDFWLIALQGIAVWCLLAPLVAAGIYYGIRPPLRALAQKFSAATPC